MKPILVHCHIYYPHLWPELKKCIQNVCTYPCDLYITMVEEHANIKKDILATFPKAHIEVIEGRGFDVGPFIHVLNQVNLDDYGYVVKLHTKRDLPENHPSFRDMHANIWRNSLLLPFSSEKTFTQYIENFEKYPKVGMSGFYKLFVCNSYDKIFDASGYNNLKLFLKEHKLKNIYFKYIAGTMFVARAELFKYIQKFNFSLNDFSPSNRKEQGDLAHVLERFFGYFVYAQGYTVQDTIVPEKEDRYFQLQEKIKYILHRISRFLFQKKITKSNILTIKICRIPIYRRKYV